MIIKRYEIFYADLNPAQGSEIKKIRPVVVVSKTEMNKYLDTIVICPATTKLHPGWRSRIQCNIDNQKAEITAAGGKLIDAGDCLKNDGNIVDEAFEHLKKVFRLHFHEAMLETGRYII